MRHGLSLAHLAGTQSCCGLWNHDQSRSQLAIGQAWAAACQVVGGEGAEGSVDPIDAGEGSGVDAGLLQKRPALRTLLARLGIAAAQVPGDGMGKVSKQLV